MKGSFSMKKVIIPIIILMTLSACSQLGFSDPEPIDLSSIESQLESLDKKVEEQNATIEKMLIKHRTEMNERFDGMEEDIDSLMTETSDNNSPVYTPIVPVNATLSGKLEAAIEEGETNIRIALISPDKYDSQETIYLIKDATIQIGEDIIGEILEYEVTGMGSIRYGNLTLTRIEFTVTINGDISKIYPAATEVFIYNFAREKHVG
ncbi:MAG: hypothetical protein CL736_05790 [Chloroflexi bacterium]|nr:hypothetical protein [Chloroflexota bacterium]|tara:strand:- start:53 stop:673 length:621 start_codon:yes stop_codon:yes gene_type:complete